MGDQGQERARTKSAQPPASERRSCTRVSVLLRVEYAAREDLAADYVTDLGEGGLFIRTDVELEVGSSINVSLSFPGLLEPTTFEGVVRWRRGPGDAVTPDQVGVGVMFLEGRSEGKQRVLGLLKDLQRPRTELKPAPASGTFRVLLAEDNSFVCELFRHALLKFQAELADYPRHDLVTARTGQEALRALETGKPDFIILDHYLPGITGCALVRRIRAMPDHDGTPILMISTGGSEVRREALDAGATLFMDKPVLLTQLLDTLRALIFKEQACH